MISALSLGGVPLLSLQVALVAFKNASFPSAVYTRTKRGGYQGSKVITPTSGSYQFIADFVLIGTSFVELGNLRDNFIGTLGKILSSGPQTLVATLPDGTQRQVDIKSIQVNGDFSISDGVSSPIEVVFEAEFPFLQGSNLKSVDVLINNGGGFAVPFAIPFDMTAGHSTVISIENLGNFAAYPQFTFQGQLTSPNIQNVTTGETLNFNDNLADSAHSLVVDTYKRTAILQPSGNVGRQYVDGDFWTIPPGISTVTLGNANGTDAGKCTISFRDTFLNI